MLKIQLLIFPKNVIFFEQTFHGKIDFNYW